MNRRELFKALSGIAASAGITAKLSACEPSDGAPALVVVEAEYPLSDGERTALVDLIASAMDSTPFSGVRTIVLDGGLRLSIIDLQGRVLNRPLENA